MRSVQNVRHGVLTYDIYTLIVDHIVRESTPKMETLKVLVLTHRTLVRLCHKHIFKTVAYSAEIAKKFLKICQDSPHIAELVPVLVFRAEQSWEREKWEDPPKNVVPFLAKFQHLRVLHLEFLNDFYRPRRWDKRHPQVSTAILTLLQSQPKLENLSIKMVHDFPLRGISALRNFSPHLQYLTLDGFTINSYHDGDYIVAILPISRCYLGSSNATQTLMKLAIPPKVPQLNNSQVLDFLKIRDMTFDWKVEEDIEATELILQYTTQLHSLCCRLTILGTITSFKGLGDAILSGPFQSIRKIVFDGSVEEVMDSQCDNFYGGVDIELLRLSGSVHALEHLEINLECILSQPDINIEATCATFSRRCKALNKILANENAFPAMHRISINFVLDINNSPNVILQEIAQAPWNPASRIKKECFSDLSALSKLHFTLTMKIVLKICL